MIVALWVCVTFLLAAVCFLCLVYSGICDQIRYLYQEISILESEIDATDDFLEEVNRKANHAMHGDMMQ